MFRNKLVVASLAMLIAACAQPPVKEQDTGLWASAGYVEPAACKECHQQIWQTYTQTGMGRSFYRPAGNAPTQDEPFYHEDSDRYYQLIKRDGRLFQSRWQLDAAGQEINVLEKQIDFIMGSGNHARTFLHQTPDARLLQAPLGWYAEDDGTWAMSPGYDRPGHDGFQRVIAYDCMFCHNGYPDLPSGADAVGLTPRYQGRIPEGIDCQRCHGPGRRHIELFQQAEPDVDAIQASIVNPARLSPDRQLEVCFQCHLETTSRPLPNVTHRYDRPFFSYHPGEPLADYALAFDHAADSPRKEKFEINHAAYRLRQSECFQRSEGAMTCTTCHDPHQVFRGTEAVARYTAVCRECHVDLAVPHPANAEANCIECHMPKRRTQDVVHAVMTDHRIARRPPPGDLLAPLPEANRLAQVRYQGEVELHYPDPAQLDPDDELYLAVAQVMQSSNVEAGTIRLQQAVEKHQPKQPEFYFEIGDAHHKAGRHAEAVPWFERALEHRSGFPLAQRRLGEALAAVGDFARAEQEFRKAAAIAPDDSDALRELGLLYARQGRASDALEVTQAALRIAPEAPALHNTRAAALAQLGRRAAAQASYREALRLQPDLDEAEYNLANLLASLGDTEQAEFHWKRVMARDSHNVQARYNYAVSLAQRDRVRESRAVLEAAVEAQPDFAPAHALLADLLQAAGSPGRALTHYSRAAELEPQSVDARWSLALARLAQADATNARRDLEQLLDLDPKHFEAHLAFGQLLLAQGDPAAAAPHLEQAARSPNPQIRAAALAAMR